MRLADEKSKCVSLQSRPLREFGQSRWSERSGSGFRGKFPFIKCINHYSLISFHFSSETTVSSVCMAQLCQGGERRLSPSVVQSYYFGVHTKFAASSVLPVPLYCATCG